MPVCVRVLLCVRVTGLLICLMIHTITYVIFPFTHQDVVTIYGVVRLNKLVWISALVRAFFLCYFFHSIKKIAPNVSPSPTETHDLGYVSYIVFRVILFFFFDSRQVVIILPQLGPLALFAFASYLVHYFLLNAAASHVTEEV